MLTTLDNSGNLIIADFGAQETLYLALGKAHVWLHVLVCLLMLTLPMMATAFNGQPSVSSGSGRAMRSVIDDHWMASFWNIVSLFFPLHSKQLSMSEKCIVIKKFII